MAMAGSTISVKKRATERLIRMTPTNHKVIRGVKRKLVKDSRNLAGAGLTLTGIDRRVAQLLFDAQQLVVLGETVGTGQRAGLDLAAVGRHRQVGNGAV